MAVHAGGEERRDAVVGCLVDGGVGAEQQLRAFQLPIFTREYQVAAEDEFILLAVHEACDPACIALLYSQLELAYGMKVLHRLRLRRTAR